MGELRRGSNGGHVRTARYPGISMAGWRLCALMIKMAELAWKASCPLVLQFLKLKRSTCVLQALGSGERVQLVLQVSSPRAPAVQQQHVVHAVAGRACHLLPRLRLRRFKIHQIMLLFKTI